jgi:hypothetical protein
MGRTISCSPASTILQIDGKLVNGVSGSYFDICTTTNEFGGNYMYLPGVAKICCGDHNYSPYL